MKKIALIVLVATFAYAQGRTEEYFAADIKINEIILNPLPDGGCTARWGGSVNSSDGGSVVSAVTPTYDLRATIMQNRCEGLRQAGEGRLGLALRVQLDGGAP